jgi:hypothetical protein
VKQKKTAEFVPQIVVVQIKNFVIYLINVNPKSKIMNLVIKIQNVQEIIVFMEFVVQIQLTVEIITAMLRNVEIA